MPRLATELSPLQVKRFSEPGLYFVGGVSGLALQVLPTGGKSWILRATVGGRRRDMGLGGYPSVQLAEARQRARAAREQIRAGVDPITNLQKIKSELAASQRASINFKKCSESYIAAHQAGWRNQKHAAQWTRTLEQYAFPVIGDLRVDHIQLAHVLTILEPIWTTKTETASRLRGRIESVLDWAKGRGYRSGDNPAAWKGNLDAQLARPEKVKRVTHHAAVPVSEMPSFYDSLKGVSGMGSKALKFLILTAARSGEVRGATWQEIDIERRTWCVPAHRMKAHREHRVALSSEAIDLLRSMGVGRDSDLVFPSPNGKPLSDMTLSAIMRRMKRTEVPHGFRSAFRDWVAELTTYPGEMAEIALAHVISNAVEAAYRRGDMFNKRLLMMDDWANYLAGREPIGTEFFAEARPSQ